MKIKINDFRDLIISILSSKNYSKPQAEKIAEVLIYAELTGKNTQGLIKLTGTEPMQNIKPEYESKISKETKISALIDGGGNAAPLVCQMASDIVIDKCKEHGVAIVGTNNTYASSGAIGFYAEKIASHDFIGLVFAGSPGGVAPFGSIEPLFGTNPLAFGFPTEQDPIIFDMATSAVTWYGLVRAKSLGEDLPEGVAIDETGNLTTNPEEAMKGAILPFDKSYKGSGLGLMVEILTGPLVGGTFATPNGTGDWSNLFIAIDPDILIGKNEFKKRNSELLSKIKNSRKAKGFSEILIPGERALRNKKDNEKFGSIKIDEKIYNELREVSQPIRR